MICRYCSADLTEANFTCPNCGSLTGVRARQILKVALYVGLIGWGAIIGSILIDLASAVMHPLYVFVPFSIIFILGGLVCALISVPLSIYGFTVKRYKLVRRR
ncbi:MAG: hypothetical protein EBT82_04180 [Micrococcales bacterium]|nr:hypothetical protein [Micrococcales bacterium]NBR61075.1 hypothetical protein [Actinomycetota bacterium]NBR55150.1 hypothetical protein [Micrococcales bacterium]NBT47458.1 hypothetical protein [Actinomycetota bacterium]NBY43350.1 hypothetical protein [Micrococcales bacterium]